MVDVRIFGLAMDDKSQAPVIILKDDVAGKVLPIWIGAMEAMSISLAINKVDFPRPMTHDLMIKMIDDLGGKIEAVEVTRIEDGTFYAELVIHHKDGTRRIDCRPSDAIALAVRVETIIRVDESVMDEAGAEATPEYEAALKSDGADKWTEELENFSTNETKYKM